MVEDQLAALQAILEASGGDADLRTALAGHVERCKQELVQLRDGDAASRRNTPPALGQLAPLIGSRSSTPPGTPPGKLAPL